jgi:hypothetical protein
MRHFAPLSLWILSALSVLALQGAEPSFIRIDQFGYLPAARKIATVADPQTGFDAALQYTPGDTLQVRWDRDLGVVFEGRPRSWRSGATHADSGDRCWLFDFSPLSTEGRYHLYDPASRHRSASFTVGRTVYRAAAIQAARMFFYQRSGFAKRPPYTNARWADAAAHTRSNQDSRARSVTDRGNAATERDLRGGWFDAGDYNKYVTFAWDAMQSLLLAYEEHPEVWGDDHAIPESGNGIPDLLDEIRWEIDWFLRMQLPDGSLLNRVHDAPGSRSASPASADLSERNYGAASTRSTVAGADVLAHGAIVFGSLGRGDSAAYAAELRSAAIRAWQWALANPNVVYTDHFGKGGDSPHSATTYAVWMCRAAAKLYRLTGDATYREYFDANYRKANLFQWNFAYVFEAPLQDALLYYARSPGATASVATDIRNVYGRAIRTGSDNLPRYLNEDDPYQAFSAAGDYTWGSNRWKAEKGGMFAVMATDQIDPANTAEYRHAAAAYLHYLHGVNPLALVYLSNMEAYGTTRSVTEFYHHWFANGTDWDSSLTSSKGPPPGYLSGGANPKFRPDASYNGPRLAPPLDQPPLKAYRDWNTSWPQNSWEVTEPAIYYQAAYLRLLAGFLDDLRPGNGTLLGLAARALVGEGDRAAFPGFSMTGSGAGRILIRVVGPGLAPFGVTGTAADPKLTLFDHSNSPPARKLENDTWEQGDAISVRETAARTGAFPLPGGSRDAAVVTDLDPGSYSVMAENTGARGVALVEVYDASDGKDRERRRLTGLSCRAQVGSGNAILIPGLVVGGTEAITLVIRALGPALRRLGVADPLADPQLTLFADSVALATNDNWEDQADSPRVWLAMRRAGLAELESGSGDAALLVTVPPGNYTVHVAGKGNSAAEGTAVVEIYEVRP